MGKKILLAENDREYLQILEMYVKRMNDFFDEYIAVTDGREAIEKGLEFQPDIVVTSLVLPGIDGIGVIAELKPRLKNTVFVVSSSILSNYAIKMAEERGATLYFAKPTEFSVFRDRLKERMSCEDAAADEPSTTLVKNEDVAVMSAITREIQQIGLSPGIKGFRYVRHAIYLMAESEKCRSMMKEIYPAVAKKFETTTACVERDIRHAIEGAWTHGSMKRIDEVFGFSVDADKGKPTNSAFISTIAERIRLGL